jgi:hypothetical protein
MVDVAPATPSSIFHSFSSVDRRRTFQLLLAVIWFLDGILQLQPFMFTPGPGGFSGMVNSMAQGNPVVIHGSISWVASLIYHHPVPTNLVFAGFQLALGAGIAHRPTARVALGASVVWSLLVWWFGEGLGGLFLGAASPLLGGPGAVLLYALLAWLVWPRDRRSDATSVAAWTVGERTSKWAWFVLWSLLAVLCVVGSGRNGAALAAVVQSLASSQPHWLAVLDHHTARSLGAHGGLVGVGAGALSLAVGATTLGPKSWRRVGVIAGIVLFGLAWILVHNFGGILGGGATDPNSGLIMMFLCALYWPTMRTEWS